MIARLITYTVIGALGVFVLMTTFLIDEGGGSATPAGRVSVHDLSLAPETYRGETVITQGDLGFSPEIQQHQIVDEGIAIVVLGYEEEALRSLEGRRVTVTGRFDFDAATGVFIDADTVNVVE